MKPATEDGSASEDEALDELLLLLLADGEARAGEIFRESRRRLELGLEWTAEGELQEAPRRRDERGAAFRLLGSGGLRAGHVSGGDLETLRALASGEAAGGPPEGIPGGPTGRRDESPTAPAGEAARRFEEAAAFLRGEAEAEPRLHRARLALARDERRVQVLSSEWGHAAAQRDWWRLELELELADEGAPGEAVRRACGWSGDEPARAFGGLVDELFAAARRLGEAVPAEPGAPPVVLAAGGGAVLFHEAVGHALEGDVAARAGTILAGRVGDRVAREGVSVLDDPSLPGRAGSADHDDEGAPGRAVALVEAGRVGEPLRDALRCGFELTGATGHGRRASHRVQPMPRMTNTWLAPGELARDEVLAGVRRGLLVERLERGAFDPATGTFRLRVAEARRIEDGRPGRSLRPFWLEGDTSSLLAGIEALGGDLEWDDGCGTCGRDGQWLPVAAGCPSVRLAEGTLRVL